LRQAADTGGSVSGRVLVSDETGAQANFAGKPESSGTDSH
jgi:hypothetical protein